MNCMPDTPETRSPHVKALARRLEDGTLSPQDKEKLDLTRRVRELRSKGYTFAKCAAELGVNQKNLEGFARAGIYKLLGNYLESLEEGSEEKSIERVTRQTRTEFALCGPLASRVIRESFKRDENDELVDKGQANWATQIVAKGLGLTEPQSVGRPVVNINIGTIQAELGTIRADDSLARGAIDITPQAVEE